jgi:hypothetical protein
MEASEQNRAASAGARAAAWQGDGDGRVRRRAQDIDRQRLWRTGLPPLYHILARLSPESDGGWAAAPKSGDEPALACRTCWFPKGVWEPAEHPSSRSILD